ncbi:prolyl oligopeptidase family serine peptidase [Patescibacteria group bacterium]|nr:prolyl oligopeptidase family serine peptidase [Patescibacteria group bacterium]
MNQKKIGLIAFFILLILLTSSISFTIAYFYFQKNSTNFLSPLKTKNTKTETKKELPLLKYSFENLSKQEFKASSPIRIEKLISKDLDTKTYVLLFTYQSQGKKISGVLNLKIDAENTKKPAIIMIRGYVPLETYYSGEGTKNAATVFAENDYLTLAPDFLGFGESDPEPADTWEARFIKVVNVVDLIRTIQTFPEIDLSQIAELPIKKVSIDTSKIGIWGHSNGGQIALSTLEVLGSNLPTTLWAPVLAPFPYSILYFSDEYEDEGKETRKYVSLFEDDYDVFDFSLTKHLDKLNGPIQIQHGTADDSALISWTEEFLAKVDLENELRATASSQSAGASQSAEKVKKEVINIDFYKYPGANHNLQPNWNQAVQKDLSFFEKYLLTN